MIDLASYLLVIYYGQFILNQLRCGYFVEDLVWVMKRICCKMIWLDWICVIMYVLKKYYYDKQDVLYTEIDMCYIMI